MLARTTGLDPAAWDLLNLLTCSPGAIPDHLLADLGVTLPALRALADAGLIRRIARGVAFRHDLCRLAIAASSRQAPSRVCTDDCSTRTRRRPAWIRPC